MNKGILPALAAAATLLGLAGAPALAQVQVPGWYGSIQGLYWIESGNERGFEVTVGGLPLTTPPDDGWGGNAKLGYRFATMPIDIAIGGGHSWLNKGKNSILAFVATEKAKYWSADIELGYTLEFPDGALRPFVGLRYADWRHHTNHANIFIRQVDMEAIGPRAGLDISGRIAPALSLFVGGSVAVLFGELEGKWLAGGLPGVKRDRTIFNAEGQAGLAWELAPLVSLAAGYRLEWWAGVIDRNVNANLSGVLNKSQDRVLHGPFVRLSYNIGVPPGAAPAAQPPAPVMAKSFIVFFDFDRSVLTPTARDTIKQASDAAKAGKSARVNVTGHADKSGADQYNMALSLRRANTVKDELVRNGVPAASIVVVGRGESQPLVPTADGVREPQNRRVEIVLN